MKKTAVIFASDNNYAIGIAITIMSLEEKNPNLADRYIVYYDEWDKKKY